MANNSISKEQVDCFDATTAWVVGHEWQTFWPSLISDEVSGLSRQIRSGASVRLHKSRSPTKRKPKRKIWLSKPCRNVGLSLVYEVYVKRSTQMIWKKLDFSWIIAYNISVRDDNSQCYVAVKLWCKVLFRSAVLY